MSALSWPYPLSSIASRKGSILRFKTPSCRQGLVDNLVALFDPTLVVVTTPWKVQKQAAVALLALLEFNKNVFVCFVLMSKLVENLVGLLDLALAHT